MKQRVYKLFLGLAFAALLGACSSVQPIIRTQDPEYIYQSALDFYEAEKWKKSAQLFENVARSYVGTEREDTISFFTARCKFKDGDYHTAISQLDTYRRFYGRSPFIEDAEGMLTLSYYNIAPGPERDQTDIVMALTTVNEFMSRYPFSDNIKVFEEVRDDLVQRLHDKSFMNAYTYYKIGRYKSALVAFKNALKEYPTTANREKILYYTVLASYELASNSVESKEADRYLALLDSYYTFVADFPESEYIKEVERVANIARKYLDNRSESETLASVE